MTCSGTQAALKAGEENPRCLRCDKMLPEWSKGDALDCGCKYAVKASPLTGKELAVLTDDPEATRLLRSLGARFAARHGWLLAPRRVRFFEALVDAEAVAERERHYRFPDGVTRSIYEAARWFRANGK